MKGIITDQILRYNEVLDQLLSVVTADGGKDTSRILQLVGKLAFYDDVGYRNIRSLNHRLLEMKRRTALNGMAIIRYNLRHFTQVHRILGHKSGDAILWEHYKRMEDLVGPNGNVARMNGDNFTAVCDRAHLDAVVAFLTETEIPYDEEQEQCITISANAGVYVFPDDYVFTSEDDIRSKVFSSYMAAMSGEQGQIVFYNESVARKRGKLTRLQQDFADALRDGEFYPVYQPKVSVVTEKICGAEALCRWNRKGENVSPGEFIPALEESSDICRLDFYILDCVCRDIRRWLDSGKEVVRVSVNLSRRHMMNKNLLSDLVRCVDAHKVPHRYHEFELTETTTDVEFNALRQVVTGLQECGFSTAVDDYGVGYSSLNLIKTVPWDVVKIDRSVLPFAAEDDRGNSGNLLKHLVAIMKEMGLQCVAEGVETEEQLALLKQTECDMIQGFFFYRPMPAEAFAEKLLSL